MPRPQGLKRVILNSTEHDILTAKKTKMLKTKTFLALKLLYVVFILEKTIKGVYSCPIEIIKGLTDKGQFAKVLKCVSMR